MVDSGFNCIFFGTKVDFQAARNKLLVIVMVYSHWLGPEAGPVQGPGRMGCMVLIRTFHTAPEQGQGRTPGIFSGPEEWVWYPFFRS